MQCIINSCARANTHFLSNKSISKFANIQIPRRVGVLGYGAIGKSFVEILLKQYPSADVVALDLYDLPYQENRFKFINNKVTRQNVTKVLDVMGLQSGDFLVDLSTNIEFMELWPLCQSNGVRYMNTALEVWEDNETSYSYPKNQQQCYETSLGWIKDEAMKSGKWNPTSGTTAIFEMGMNPGLISHCVKKGLEDAGNFYLRDPKATDLDKKALEKWLADKNHSKIAQVLGCHTIHCSETDNQVLDKKPADMGKKFYNTWSCRGFLTEGLVPIQVARGSHEDKEFKDYCVIRNGETIMSYEPSTLTWANSWLPNQNIKGVLIPHGEAYSIRDYLHDKETGYAPSQYYVYEYNTYAKDYIMNLPSQSTLDNTKPEMEVMHPMNHPSLRGVDKVGALMVMKNNRGWWTGSVMDDVDCRDLFDFKFGPTVLQVAAGVYAGFLWGCKNPNNGTRYPESLDTDFIFKHSSPYLGRVVSSGADLSKTSIKDCYKLQSFLTTPPPKPIIN